mmetsp:Transcript_26075/g.48614  ORF Transcript_26075/g.48614 Transcript_26075/m.48614 type:complete len:96 (-) Transcript_26075:759-1046(-)
MRESLALSLHQCVTPGGNCSFPEIAFLQEEKLSQTFLGDKRSKQTHTCAEDKSDGLMDRLCRLRDLSPTTDLDYPRRSQAPDREAKIYHPSGFRT